MGKELDRLFSDLSLSWGAGRSNPAAALSPAEELKYLDTSSLDLLETSFRKWADDAIRADIRLSRRRITLIFLLIRYTGARLGEILSLDEVRKIDFEKSTVFLGECDPSDSSATCRNEREVEIPSSLTNEINELLTSIDTSIPDGQFFNLDPAHVRRKFYERAQACGLPREFGNPSSIRKSRAIELIRSNIPLPMVQKILGHSTSNLTSSYIDFSADDMKKVLRSYVDRESKRKTSARNSFFGAVSGIRRGDIQSEIEITTYSGNRITSVITNESLERLMLRAKSLVYAEIKAPWVVISVDGHEPLSSASNRLKGRVTRCISGSITAEAVVTLDDGTEVCGLMTGKSMEHLGIVIGQTVWVSFSAFSVVLNSD